jgi:hypothetical protein
LEVLFGNRFNQGTESLVFHVLIDIIGILKEFVAFFGSATLTNLIGIFNYREINIKELAEIGSKSLYLIWFI